MGVAKIYKPTTPFNKLWNPFTAKYKTGVPKLSPSVYPFSISIDERVPLNMGAGGIFSREGPIVDFPGVGQKYFCREWPIAAKLRFNYSKQRKQPFFAKNWWENVKFQNPGAALASTLEAHVPETFYDEKAEEDNKNIFTNKHAMIF